MIKVSEKRKPATASRKKVDESDGFSGLLRKTAEAIKSNKGKIMVAAAATAVFVLNFGPTHHHDQNMALYTEQIGVEPIYIPSTNKISFEVDAIRQPDAMTRTFTVNGFTSDKQWIQVGLSSFGNVPENVEIYGEKVITKDFTMAYDIFNPNGELVAGSALTGHIKFSGKVNDNDKVLLNLEIKDSMAIMSGYDEQTGAMASVKYPVNEDTVFVPTIFTEFKPHEGGGGHLTSIMDETTYIYPIQQKGKLREQKFVMITPKYGDGAKIISSYFSEDRPDPQNPGIEPRREIKSLCESYDKETLFDLVCDGTEASMSGGVITIR